MVSIINKFDGVQETNERHTLNNEYENLVWLGVGFPLGIMVKTLDYRILASLNSSCAIMFTFGQLPFRKV